MLTPGNYYINNNNIIYLLTTYILILCSYTFKLVVEYVR